MSETVRYTGKLVRLHRLNHLETLEEQCKRLYGKELDKCYDDYQEALQDVRVDNSSQQSYIIHGDDVYKVKEFKDKEIEEDSFELKRINGNDFEFEVMYYNGGCGFSEALDYAFENLKDE